MLDRNMTSGRIPPVLETIEPKSPDRADHQANGTGSGGGTLFGKIVKWLFAAMLVVACVLIAMVVAYRFVTPASTLMLGRYLLHEKVDRQVVPLGRISPNLLAAVVASEDARFCSHHGVDWGALREVLGHARDEGIKRGASTITMQTAKNVFLWPSHSYIRKVFEIPLALGLDEVWPKRRILEIYLNVAEWGDGIFGIEAAAQNYFHKPASELDPQESALLAAVLPNPHLRSPLHPTRRTTAHAKIVTARLARAAPHLDCLR
jgi:monofunctional biosynthetic peptidoglycan transglycosylase